MTWRRKKAGGDEYAAVVSRLEKVYSREPWVRHRPNFWSGVVFVSWEGTGFDEQLFSVTLGVPDEEHFGAFTEALIGTPIPPEARQAVIRFCAAANARFTSCNLSLRRYDDFEGVVSSGVFLARESRGNLPAQLVETMVSRAIRAAVIATPAVRDLAHGAGYLEALAVAEDQTFGFADAEGDNQPSALNPKVLIDEAVAALREVDDLPAFQRTSPSRLQGRWGAEGSGRGCGIEAGGSALRVVCFPIEPVAEEQRSAMAEFLSLVAGTGGESALGLDADTGVVSFSNSASFAGTEPPRDALLRDFLLEVLRSPDRYVRQLEAVARGDLDANSAFARAGREQEADPRITALQPWERDGRDVVEVFEDQVVADDLVADDEQLLQPLPVHQVVLAAAWAAEAHDLELVVPPGGVARIFGPAGTLGNFNMTEAWFYDGGFLVKCGVPVVIPELRREQALELCVGLNSQGRAGFSIGPRDTPVASVDIRLVVGAQHAAASLCLGALETVWEKAVVSSTLFRAVADGADPAEVLAGINEVDDPELFSAIPVKQGSSGTPYGTEWAGVLDDTEITAVLSELPDFLAEDEVRALATVFPSLVEVDGLADGCAGPVLFHADGHVECYGCTNPAANPHLKGATVTCFEGLYLGDGHRCERCGDAE